MKLFHIVLYEGQTRKSNILLHDQIVETLFCCYDDSPLHSKFFELFKCFRLVFHQVDLPISAQIIYEGWKITIPARASTLIGPHTSVCIISNKSLARSIVSENGVLVILP